MASKMLGMVFAAGLGTRLRPLTERLPKPVVPLVNRPLASFSLERLAAAGVTDCAVNTHHLADEVPRALEGHAPEAMRVRFVREETLLGTGGGLRNGLRTLVDAVGVDDDSLFLVMNGDIFFWPDLEGAIALHRRLDAVATVVLRPDPRARQLGALEVDADGRVRRLLGRPEEVAAGPLEEHMFTGVHVLSPRALSDLPEEGCVIRRAYRRWIDTGAVVGGFVDGGAWRDLGTPAEYLRAHLDLLDGALRWPGFEPPPDGVLRGAGATVGEGARLSRVVLGPGARVAPGVSLERAVVWPGTTVTESARDAILAPHARVDVA
jgi:mannose-1-phosphate guanylyltransferase